MLKLDGISKTYRVGTFGGKELRAVKNISFDIAPGEVVSLIGESGSGKSTIGKMILRLISATSGTIEFDGIDVSTHSRRDLRDYYRRVQGVFQDPFSSYNPIFKADRVFSIIKQVYFRDVPDDEWDAKLRSSLEAVGLHPPEVLDKYPHQLSGGQLQRFLIARALLLDIDVLVADEIISMLDASTRIDVLNLLAELKTRGLAILFITHDLSLGYYISERAVILYKGAIAEMGTTDRVFNNPLHPYTQMLMRSVPHLDSRWEGREKVSEGPEEDELATGCAYFARCPLPEREQGCEIHGPKLLEVEPGHFVSCRIYADAAVDADAP